MNAPLRCGFEAGVRRAATRMQRLLASEALRDVYHEGFLHSIHNEGQKIYADTVALAA